MSVFTPVYKLTINGVEYTNVAIQDITHQAGRDDIYAQPLPSYLQISLEKKSRTSIDLLLLA